MESERAGSDQEPVDREQACVATPILTKAVCEDFDVVDECLAFRIAFALVRQRGSQPRADQVYEPAIGHVRVSGRKPHFRLRELRFIPSDACQKCFAYAYLRC